MEVITNVIVKYDNITSGGWLGLGYYDTVACVNVWFIVQPAENLVWK